MFRQAVLFFCLFIVLTEAERKVQVTVCFLFVTLMTARISKIRQDFRYSCISAFSFFASDNHVWFYENWKLFLRWFYLQMETTLIVKRGIKCYGHLIRFNEDQGRTASIKTLAATICSTRISWKREKNWWYSKGFVGNNKLKKKLQLYNVQI